MKPRRAVERRRGWLLPVTFVLVLLLGGGALWVFQPQLRALLGEDPRVDTGDLLPRVAPAPTPVLPAPTPAATPVSAGTLKAKLDAVPRAGLTDVAISVLDATTGTVLYADGAAPQVPASTLKVLTGLVALDVLGPERTFTTRVVRGTGDRVVLVGGGDPLLNAARSTTYPGGPSLEELALATASALRASGTTSVTLGYDASLFGQPAWHPDWSENFKWSVAPVSALTADHAMPNLKDPARAPDPARFAADRFAGYLAAQGVAVGGVAAQQAPTGATVLATAESLPVATLVEQALLHSDNDTAETLAWQVALARGQGASFAGAAAALTNELKALGLWDPGMNVADGNGISGNNRVTAGVLARAIRRGVDEPRLRALITGLPVAGVTGTLDERFAGPSAQAGRGVVRAKTGTIRGVHALAGLVVTAAGQPLVFAFVLNDAAGSDGPRAWIDQAASVLASCGCS